MKKNPSLKIFNLVAKRVYKISKKRKLGWTWQMCQKWTSANLFQKYKTQKFSKIKVTDVDKDVIAIIEGSAMPIPKAGGKKAVEVCFNINQITNDQTDDVPFYYLYDRIFGGNGEVGFDDNLKIAVEIDGYVSTGVIKKYELSTSSIYDLIKSIRALDLASGEFDIIFKRVFISNKDSEKDNPCNGYILITMAGSSADVGTSEVDMDVKKQNLTPELQAKIDEAKRLDTEAKELKALKQQALKQERPKAVEPKPAEPIKATTENRETELRKVLEILKEDFKDGILTKKQYLARQKQILDKFEKGGKI
jgi:hypothetical protein